MHGRFLLSGSAIVFAKTLARQVFLVGFCFIEERCRTMRGIRNSYKTLASDMPLFSNLHTDDTEKVLDALNGEILNFVKDEIISEYSIKEKLEKSFYLVLTGMVEFVSYGQDGRRCIIDYTMPGGVIGYADVFGSLYVRGGQYIAGKDCTLLRLDLSGAQDIDQRTAESLKRSLIRIISDKTSRLLQKVDIVSRKTVREKIMTFLSYEAQIHGDTKFEIPLNRQELADYICVDRTTLCSELGEMQKAGLIKKGKRTFQLLSRGD